MLFLLQFYTYIYISGYFNGTFQTNGRSSLCINTPYGRRSLSFFFFFTFGTYRVSRIKFVRDAHRATRLHSYFIIQNSGVNIHVC